MVPLSRLFSAEDAPDEAAEPWLRQRRPPRGSDEALTGTTRGWLRRLPSGRRPLHLCERFPRVANRIAWCWADAALADQVLDDLLTDRRGGREGFPRAVVVELRRLRDFRAQQAGH
jgi:hypothetical protein